MRRWGIPWTGGQTLAAIPDDWKVVGKLLTSFGEKETWFINERAAYKLAFRSNKPEADKFTKWVVEEVLPQVRNTGMYSFNQEAKVQNLLANPGTLSQVLLTAAAEAATVLDDQLKLIDATTRDTAKPRMEDTGERKGCEMASI